MKHCVLPVFLILCFATFLHSESTRLAKGEIAEKVNSKSYPGLSHAIYIPSNYDPAKKWPVLYCFDARERGKTPAELFREGAEKHGYLIFASNNSRSDDPNAQNIEAMQSMWKDSHAWFSIDDRRTYATGFSGGSRVAWGMGTVYPLAGVIGCGGGPHADRPPSRDIKFAYFGAVGITDFNYNEFRQLQPVLQSFGIRHRIENFDGAHQWPPREVCTKAIDWMEIQGMKDGRREKDATVLKQLFDARLSEATTLETSGKTYEAYIRYQQLAEDFDSLLDVNEQKVKAQSLAQSEPIRKRIELRKKVDDKEEETQANFRRILGDFRSSSGNVSAVKLKSDLRINYWREQKTEHANSDEGLLAERLLQTAFVQTVFYLPGYFVEKKDYNRALVSLTLATEIYPENWSAWYSLACVHAKKGDKKKAVENLKVAIQKGFSDLQTIQQDPDLTSIRNEEEFQQILKSLQK